MQKNLLSLLAGILFATTVTAEVVYEPLEVKSGFNRDVIAETYPMNTSNVISYLQETGYYYSMATESVIRSVNNNYQESHPGYFSDDNLVDIPLQGWPDDPTNDPANRIIRCREDGDAINNPLYKDVYFQLAPYDEPNVLTIRPDNCIGGTGTLKFKKVGCYDKVFFLLMSAFEGSRPSVRNAYTTIYYTDGTSENSVFEFSGLSGKETHNVRKTNIYEDKFKKWSKADSNKSYAAVFDMDVDPTKLIDRIEFRNTINQTAVMIFGVAGRTADMEIPEAAKSVASNIETNSFQACWEMIEDAASYRLDVAEDEDFQRILEEYNNKVIDEGTCDEVAGLLAEHEYYWRVRSVNSAGGQSASSAPKRVKTQSAEGPQQESEESADIEKDMTALLNTTTNLTFARTLYKDGCFNTLCLPFSLTAEQIAAHDVLSGCQLYVFDHADKIGDAQLNVYVNETDNIEAGMPYLIKWANTGEVIHTLTFNGITITTATGLRVGEGVQFVGNIATAALTNGDHNTLFVGANNTLYWPNTNLGLKGFRAYFAVPADGPSSVPSGMPARIVASTNVTTDIETITAAQSPLTYKVIRDGVFYIIRDGVLFNAQGQKVQ